MAIRAFGPISLAATSHFGAIADAELATTIFNVYAETTQLDEAGNGIDVGGEWSSRWWGRRRVCE